MALIRFLREVKGGIWVKSAKNYPTIGSLSCNFVEKKLQKEQEDQTDLPVIYCK